MQHTIQFLTKVARIDVSEMPGSTTDQVTSTYDETRKTVYKKGDTTRVSIDESGRITLVDTGKS